MHEIELDNYLDYTLAIQSNNKDLILFSEKVLTIYRLKNNKYVQVQKISNNRAGYHEQRRFTDCTTNYHKPYKAKFIKEISGNRFILVSNYGYKIYSLNEKKEYTVTLLEEYYDDLENIIELDKNNFIFLLRTEYGEEYDNTQLLIEKISLKEISEEKKKKKLEEIEEIDYYDDDSFPDDFFSGFFDKEQSKKYKIFSEEEIKNIIESLEYIHKKQLLLNYFADGSYHYFKGNLF